MTGHECTSSFDIALRQGRSENKVSRMLLVMSRIYPRLAHGAG
jgi:hypothetical protein